MNIYKKILISISFIIVVLVLIGLRYYLLVNNKNLPYRNITDNYGYIYVNIKAKDKSCTVVGESSLILNLITFKDSADFFGRSSLSRGIMKTMTIFKINSSIQHNNAIEVSEPVFKFLQNGKVDINKANQFSKIDLIKKGFIKESKVFKSDYLINDSLNSEDFNAIIYIMLKNNKMDCRRYCETGGVYLVFENKKK